MMGRIGFLTSLAWRNLWRSPRRTVITVIVVAVGLYSILCFAALLQAWAQSSRDTTLNLMTGSGQIHAQGYLDDPTVGHRMTPPTDALKAVLDADPIRTWAARVRVPALVQSEYKTLPLTLVGVEPARERRISALPAEIVGGHYLSGDTDASIVLGRHLAQRLKTLIGRRVIIMAQAADGTLSQQSYTVIGLFAGNINAEDRFAFTGMRTAQTMLGIGDAISEISFDVPDGNQLAAAVAALQSAAPHLDVQPWTILSPLAAAIDGFMSSFVYIWLGIMFALMAIGIINTQLMAVFERVREFGLLQALGMRPRLILLQVSIESAILVGVGVVIGLFAAIATILPLARGVDLGFLAQGAEYFGAGHVLYPRVAVGQFVGFSLLIWGLGVVVSLWPARMAANANPVEAMSHES